MKIKEFTLCDLEMDYVKYMAIKKLNWFSDTEFLKFLNVACELYDWDFWSATENLIKSSTSFVFGKKIDYDRLKSYAFASVIINLLTEDMDMIFSLPEGYEKWLVCDDENDEASAIYNDENFIKNILSTDFVDLQDDIMYFLDPETFVKSTM